MIEWIYAIFLLGELQVVGGYQRLLGHDGLLGGEGRERDFYSRQVALGYVH